MPNFTIHVSEGTAVDLTQGDALAFRLDDGRSSPRRFVHGVLSAGPRAAIFQTREAALRVIFQIMRAGGIAILWPAGKKIMSAPNFVADADVRQCTLHIFGAPDLLPSDPIPSPPKGRPRTEADAVRVVATYRLSPATVDRIAANAVIAGLTAGRYLDGLLRDLVAQAPGPKDSTCIT